MEAKSPNCGICEQRSLSVPAEIWCNDCGEGLCGPCKDHHGLSKSSRHHKTIQIAKYLDLPPLIQELRQFCEVHTESFQMFCKDHELPCCRRCAIESHEKCKLAILDDIIGNVKTSVAFVELEQTIKDLASNITKILENRENNMKSLEIQKEKIKKRIKEKKDEIINHFNKLEDKLILELEEKAKLEETNLQECIRLAKQTENEIADCGHVLEKIKQHSSDLQCFLAAKQIEEKISALETFTLSEDTSNVLCDKRLSFEYEKTATDIETSVKRLGMISVVELPAKLQLSCKKSKGAQISTQKTTTNTIETITLKIEERISTDCRSISGLTVIPEGIAFSTRGSKTVVCINRQGTVIFMVKTATDAFDIEYIPSLQNIAVSSGGNNPNKVTLINISTKQESRQSYALPSYVYGLALKKESIFCAVKYISHKKAIYFFNVFSRDSQCGIEKIEADVEYESYIACFHGNIYYTNTKVNSVTCCKESGEVVWMFQKSEVLAYPSGIAIDSSGIVYVVGYNSSNIVAISPDGKKHKQLLSKHDGLDNPRAVHYDANKNELLVANYRNTIFICSLCNF